MSDRYGVIDEDFLSLTTPRLVDDTAVTMEEALRAAVVLLREGTEQVTVCTVRIDNEGLAVESASLITLIAREALMAQEDEDADA